MYLIDCNDCGCWVHNVCAFGNNTFSRQYICNACSKKYTFLIFSFIFSHQKSFICLYFYHLLVIVDSSEIFLYFSLVKINFLNLFFTNQSHETFISKISIHIDQKMVAFLLVWVSTAMFFSEAIIGCCVPIIAV